MLECAGDSDVDDPWTTAQRAPPKPALQIQVKSLAEPLPSGSICPACIFFGSPEPFKESSSSTQAPPFKHGQLNGIDDVDSEVVALEGLETIEVVVVVVVVVTVVVVVVVVTVVVTVVVAIVVAVIVVAVVGSVVDVVVVVGIGVVIELVVIMVVVVVAVLVVVDPVGEEFVSLIADVPEAEVVTGAPLGAVEVERAMFSQSAPTNPAGH